jgi:DNA-binding CsgD family transcriptional regulator
MGKSDLLRVQDVRDAYRLIGECRDLGGDPARWQVRMCEGLRQLIGAPVSTVGEGLLVGFVALTYFDSGFDAHGRALLEAYHRDRGPRIDPFFQALLREPGRLVTRTRRQMVPDAGYYRSGVFTRYLGPGGADHRLASIYQTVQGGAISVLHLHRAPGERDFSPRELRLLKFFHGELGALVGRALVSAAEPSPEKLSPRLRQTLACLLEGDSEKHVAARLGLSQATTHQYVTALYRRFGVRSRAQLLAHALRRAGDGRWRSVTG